MQILNSFNYQTPTDKPEINNDKIEEFDFDMIKNKKKWRRIKLVCLYIVIFRKKKINKSYPSQLQRSSLRICQQRNEKGLYFKEKKDSWILIHIRAFKCLLQYSVGIGILILIINKMFLHIGWSPFGQPWEFLQPFFWELGSMGILKIAGTGLFATTAIDLAYMLFTPGPDEAVEPIITAIAAFVLIVLSNDISDLKDLNLLGLAGLILAIPILFWVKRKYIER